MRPLRLRHVPPLAARGFGRLIGPLAQTLGLQERGCAPFAFATCRRWRPGVSAGLLGLWPKRSAYRSADAPPSPSPRAAVGGPGFRPAYWAFGPNARPTGARMRPLRLRPVPPFEPDQKKRTVDKIPLM